MNEEWVKYYALYRPPYAVKAIEDIIRISKISNSGNIADIGSGTGILSRQFLDLGYDVTGVEPNSKMKTAGDKMLSNYKNFVHLKGRAEETTLPKNSVDLIVVGSAFHWFDRVLTRNEFLRISRHPFWCAILQNRQSNESLFMSAYNKVVKKYRKRSSEELFGHVRVKDEEYGDFFRRFQIMEYENNFTISYKELEGKLCSVSYLPEKDSEDHTYMIQELKSVFDDFKLDNKVLFTYKTKLVIGVL